MPAAFQKAATNREVSVYIGVLMPYGFIVVTKKNVQLHNDSKLLN